MVLDPQGKLDFGRWRLSVSRWITRWLTTTNHKDVGTLYLAGSMYFGFVGAILAMLMRTQLSAPLNDFLGAAQYNEAVSLHGLLMILWFLTPLGIALANYLVPLQIGAKDLALPRLNALSFWIYFFGGVMAILGFLLPGGNANSGWTMYAPLSNNQYSPGPGPSLAFVGIAMDVVAIMMTTVNMLLTVAYMRGPGVTWRRVPMFTWFIVFMQLQAMFAFPSLLAGLLMLTSDRVLGTLYLAASSGGSILWDNIFWFFGHPEVYVVLLPAFGMVAEIFPVFAHRHLAERNLILVLAGAGVVPLSYLVWQHHMFITGVNLSEDQAFSISTLMISLPFDLIVLAFIKTLTKARIEMSVPLLFAWGAIVVFVVGGISGVFLSSYVLDTVYRGTFFVIAHFHYIMVGASIFGLFAGIYFYLPRMTGRLFHRNLGVWHFIISFIGFNIAFFPMFFLYDMPRRIYTYQPLPSWDTLNLISTIGAFIFASAQILLLINIFYTVKRGPISPPNPWRSPGLEWVPSIVGASPSAGYSEAVVLPAASPPPAAVQSTLEHASARPILLALGMGVTLTGVALLTSYPIGWFVVAVGLVLDGYALLGWVWDDYRGSFKIGPEVTEVWPFNGITKERLGMWLFISTEMFLFGAIISSDIYIRLNTAGWPAAGSIHDVMTGGWASIALLSRGAAMVFGWDSIRRGDRRGLVRWLWGALILGTAFIALHVYEWYDYYYVRNPPFTLGSGIAGSTYFFTVGLHAAHVISGLFVMAYVLRKASAGGYDETNHTGVSNLALYWLFIDIVWMFLFPFFYLT
jgi:cytochrome c oxidase subunit I+III